MRGRSGSDILCMQIFSNRRKSDILTMSLPSLTAVRFKISSQRCFYPSCSTHILSLDGLRRQLPQLSPDRGSHAPPDRRLRRTGIFQSGKWYCKQERYSIAKDNRAKRMLYKAVRQSLIGYFPECRELYSIMCIKK